MSQITFKKIIEVPDESKELHSPFFAEDIRTGDVLSVTLRIKNLQAPKELKLSVWRFSPVGIELLVDKSELEILNGSEVDLELTIGDQISNFSGLVVDFCSHEYGRHIVGIRMVKAVASRADSGERRHEQRWSCSDDFFPTAVASNPAKYNDFVYFKVRNISGQGMQFTTSLRNKFIVPGIRFDCLLNLPMVARLQTTVKVSNVKVISIQGKETLAVGVTIEEKDRKVQEALGQYLFQFGDVDSIDDLRQQNLYLSTVSSSVDFRFVKTNEDYQKVLDLRRDVYIKAGKVPSNAKAEDMGDIYDSRARIVMGIYKGKVVCTARLVFNEYNDRMEQEEYLDVGDKLPRADEVVEIMRTCTHSSFRGSDLLLSMFRFIALTVVQSKRRYILMSTTKDLVPLYSKLGFKDTGLAFPHQKLNGTIHHVLLADMPAAISGYKVNPLHWSILWGDLTSYMQQYGILQTSRVSSMRMSVYRLLTPFAYFLLKRAKKPRVNKPLVPVKNSHQGQTPSKPQGQSV